MSSLKVKDVGLEKTDINNKKTSIVRRNQVESKLFILVFAFGWMWFVTNEKAVSAEVGAKMGVEPSTRSGKLEVPDMGFKDGFEICFNGHARCLILTSIKWAKQEYKIIQVIHGQLVTEQFLSKTEFDNLAAKLVGFFKRNPGNSSKQSKPCLEHFVLTHKRGNENPETITGCTNWLSKSEKDVILNL